MEIFWPFSLLCNRPGKPTAVMPSDKPNPVSKEEDEFQKLVNILRDKDVDEFSKRKAIEKLSLIKERVKEVRPLLIDALKDKSDFVRAASIRALDNIKEDYLEDTKNILLEVIKNDKDPYIKSIASEAIVNIGEIAIPGLVEIFKGTREFSDCGFITNQILLQLGEPAAKCLIELFKDQDGVICDKAVSLLVEMNKTATPVLLQALKNDNPLVVAYTLKSLSKIDFHNVRDLSPSSIVDFLKNPNKDVRAAAAKMLSRFWRKQSEYVLPHLNEALKDSKPDVRAAAIGAIGKISGLTRRVDILPTIIAISKDLAPSVRASAAKQLERFADSKESIIRLVELARDTDSNVKDIALARLLRIGKPALEVLLELQSKNIESV